MHAPVCVQGRKTVASSRYDPLRVLKGAGDAGCTTGTSHRKARRPIPPRARRALNGRSWAAKGSALSDPQRGRAPALHGQADGRNHLPQRVRAEDHQACGKPRGQHWRATGRAGGSHRKPWRHAWRHEPHHSHGCRRHTSACRQSATRRGAATTANTLDLARGHGRDHQRGKCCRGGRGSARSRRSGDRQPGYTLRGPRRCGHLPGTAPARLQVPGAGAGRSPDGDRAWRTHSRATPARARRSPH